MKYKLRIISIIVFVSVMFYAFTSPTTDRHFDIVRNLDIFATLYKEINAHYVDEINPSQLMRTGINAMLASLDPYTDYIPEDDIEDYRTITTGEYGGIGAIVVKKKGVSTVVLPYEGYPAHDAGLKAGDQIHKINGIKLDQKNADEISRLLKGQSQSTIELTIKRYGQEKPFEVTLNRERISISNVPYYGMVTGDIGYLKLTDFTTEAGSEVRNAVSELKEDGAKKIILDLRGNPGGLLGEAVNVSNVFIDKGKEVVTTRGRLKNWFKTYNTLNEASDTNIPLAILVDNNSASAAEIVSGVVQDYDRGVLVGRKTFGKGLVQETRPLSYNAQLKVTTMKYYIPSGRCIQAIDYSLRNPDGSVGKIPDSLKREFKTASGRLVYDGGGVDVDVEVEQFEYAPITYSLLTNDLIFDYATEYYYSHPEIAAAKQFNLTDDEYVHFKNWLSDKSYDYTTEVERDIEKLIASAKQEKYYNDISQQILNLKNQTLHNKEKDLINFEDEIRKVLEQEIAGRYYLQSGMVESTFNDDEDILTAIEVLDDSDRYSKILRGR